jgi:hypothetical protein
VIWQEWMLLDRSEAVSMKLQTGAGTPAASEAVRHGGAGIDDQMPPAVSDDAGVWLKGALDRVILQQRPNVPGWGLLSPNQSVGEYAARDSYLLLVFDHRGRPHTCRFTSEELARLRADQARAGARFKSLIASFCSDA